MAREDTTKKGIKGKIETAAKAFSLATAVAMAWSPSLKDDKTTFIPTSPQSASATPDQQQKLYQEFHFDEHGNKRGTLDFAWNILHANAPDNHKWAYDIAEHARDLGVHPLPILLFIANETGLDEDYIGDRKNAQGPFQTQTGWFIENVRKYAAETEFYKEQAEDSPYKAVIDYLLNDKSLRKEDERIKRAESMRIMFAKQDVTDPDWDISQMRFHRKFMAQLMAAKFSKEFPELQIENLPKDAEEAVNVITTTVGKAYSQHLKGETGSNYIYALAAAVPSLSFADTDALQNAANTLQKKNDWISPFSAASWKKYTDENQGPFPAGKHTKLGDVPSGFSDYISLKATLVMNELNPIIQVASPTTGQPFENYMDEIKEGNPVPDALGLLHQSTQVDTSLSPTMRPASIAFAVQAHFEEKALTSSPRPKARPDEEQITPKTVSSTQKTPLRPRARPFTGS